MRKLIKEVLIIYHIIQNYIGLLIAMILLIFLNKDKRLYKINPSLVKSHMIDVREYKLDDEFIKSLIDNINIWDISDVIQCTLYYNQRGA